MNTPVTAMLVDDHPMAREGLVRTLHAFDDRFRIVAEARNVEGALVLAPSSCPDVVRSDLHFATGNPCNGIDLIERTRELRRDAGIKRRFRLDYRSTPPHAP